MRSPRLFTVPARLAMQVPLSHPEFGWFAELGLRWHAVPVISGMRLGEALRVTQRHGSLAPVAFRSHFTRGTTHHHKCSITPPLADRKTASSGVPAAGRKRGASADSGPDPHG